MGSDTWEKESLNQFKRKDECVTHVVSEGERSNRMTDIGKITPCPVDLMMTYRSCHRKQIYKPLNVMAELHYRRKSV